MMKRTGPTASLLALSTLAFGACSPKAPPPQPAAAVATPAAAAMTLPISLNAVMVAQVDHASDYLWDIGNGKTPKTDDDWREAEYHAYQMVIAGKLIQLAGTGPNDAVWTAAPDWRSRSESLTAVGMEALKLAQAKDAAGFRAMGDKLIDVCEGCHTAYKPDIPSMRILHKPDMPHKAGG